MFQRWCARGLIRATMFLLIGQVLWAASTQLSGRVVDENGLAVEGALVTLSGSSLPASIYRSSDEIGRFLFAAAPPGECEIKVEKQGFYAFRPKSPPGECEIKVEKQGFYAFVSKSMSLREGSNVLEVVLNHQQEFEEKVDVVYSAPIIDREEIAVQNTLTSEP